MPLLDVSIEPTSPSDADHLRCALDGLLSDGKTFSFRQDHETGQWIISGTSEAQLDAQIDVLRQACQVKVNVGCLQVAYRETFVSEGETRYTYKRQTGGSVQYAEVALAFEPRDRGSGIHFENKAAASAVPLRYVPIVDKAVRLQAQTGVLAGFPTLDFKFTLIDGRYHDVDSTALAFEIAAKACFRELQKTDSLRLIEPVMRVEVVTPREYASGIMRDLRERSGQLPALEPRDNTETVTVLAPLKAMLGYELVLNALSAGMAKLSMRYETHQEVALSEPPDDRFPSAMAMRA